MIHIEASSADVIWWEAAQRVRAEGVVQSGRDQETRELLHVAMTLTEPRQRLMFGRAINPAQAIAEVIWILTGSNDVEFIGFWNQRMRRFVDGESLSLHGAYGFRLGSRPQIDPGLARSLRHEYAPTAVRLDQLKAAYEALRQYPDSRQVVLQLWDSAIDMPNPELRSKDIPCNVVSHLLVRENRLDWLQVMRSNDLIWGLPINLVQFTALQEIMAGWLGIDVGTYNHVSDSLHVYKRHWEELDGAIRPEVDPPRNNADLRIVTYAAWEHVWAQVVALAMRLTHTMAAPELLTVATEAADLPPAYAEWLVVLAAEALRKAKHLEEAMEVIERAGVFWSTSWRQWAASKGA